MKAPEPLKPGDRVRLTRAARVWVRVPKGCKPEGVVKRVLRGDDDTAMVDVAMDNGTARWSANCWEKVLDKAAHVVA